MSSLASFWLIAINTATAVTTRNAAAAPSLSRVVRRSLPGALFPTFDICVELDPDEGATALSSMLRSSGGSLRLRLPLLMSLRSLDGYWPFFAVSQGHRAEHQHSVDLGAEFSPSILAFVF